MGRGEMPTNGGWRGRGDGGGDVGTVSTLSVGNRHGAGTGRWTCRGDRERRDTREELPGWGGSVETQRCKMGGWGGDTQIWRETGILG